MTIPELIELLALINGDDPDYLVSGGLDDPWRLYVGHTDEEHPCLVWDKDQDSFYINLLGESSEER